MQILITIVSEQAVPNYLFLKEHQAQFDFFVFISTSAMEQRGQSQFIIDAAGISTKKVNIIQVAQNELYATKQKITGKAGLHNTDTYWVNITGGTKLMSNAVFDLFKNFNSRFFYVPIGENNYLELFNSKPALKRNFNYELSIREYLKIYGIGYETSEQYFTGHAAILLMQNFINTGNDTHSFQQQVKKKASRPKKFIEHQWFEEYCFHLIKATYGLTDEQIVTGIELFKMNDDSVFPNVPKDNELDVAFIYRNNFYIVEAKYSIGNEKINAPNLNQYIYKLAAVNKRFGLRARATMCTLADLTQLTAGQFQNLENRCAVTGIHPPFHRNTLTSKALFKRSFKTFLK